MCTRVHWCEKQFVNMLLTTSFLTPLLRVAMLHVVTWKLTQQAENSKLSCQQSVEHYSLAWVLAIYLNVSAIMLPLQSFLRCGSSEKKNELMCNIATPTLRRAIALHRQLHATNCKQQWESAEWLLFSLSLLPPMLLLLLLFLFIHLNARCVLQKCN